MQRQCKHPTCGEVCRREKKQPKRYELKRTPIQRKPGTIKKGIRQVAPKRAKQLREYSIRRVLFLAKNNVCQIKAPGVCTYEATVIHHTNGRENERLLIEEDWLASCATCNIWIEANDAWARERKVKLYKHRKYQ